MSSPGRSPPFHRSPDETNRKWESLLNHLRTPFYICSSDTFHVVLVLMVRSADILSDLNALIFDYLVVEGFSDAAVEFARETGIPSTIDQDMIQERMEIRQAVEDGRVEEAVRRVNELDPEVSDSRMEYDFPND